MSSRACNTLLNYFPHEHRVYRYNHSNIIRKYRQLHINNSLTLANTRPVTSIQDYHLKHRKRRVANVVITSRKHRAMDLREFVNPSPPEQQADEQLDEQEHTGAVEVQEQALNTADVQQISSSESSDSEDTEKLTLKNDIDKLKERISCLQEQNSVMEKRMSKSAAPQKRRQSSVKNQTSVKRPKYKVPPPPRSDQAASGGKEKPTVLSFLLHLQTMMTIRLDEYAEAYNHFLLLEGSKAPTLALKIIADLLTDWYNMTLSMDGKCCFFASLVSCYGQKWSTRCIAPAVSDCLMRFFGNFGQPGTTGPNPSVDSRRLSSTPATAHTITSSTTVIGGTQHVSVAGSSHGEAFPRPARQRQAEKFVPKIFSDLQITCARERDTLYTSRSRDTSGSTIIKLEVYRKSEVESLPRKSWWAVADFRGTVMTDDPKMVSQAYCLMDQMETDMESRPNVECTQSSVSSILSRGKWQE